MFGIHIIELLAIYRIGRCLVDGFAVLTFTISEEVGGGLEEKGYRVVGCNGCKKL